MKDYRVRAGEMRDLQAVVSLALANRVRHRELGAVRQESIPELRLRYAVFLGSDPARLSAVVEELPEERVVGIAVAVLSDGVANINDAYVAAPHRRRGLCRRMVRLLAGEFARHRVTEVTLQWWVDNAEGAAAWTAMGFEPQTVHARIALDKLR